jgi:rod shape determining protein RodA
MAFIGGTLILASGISYWQLGAIFGLGLVALPFLQSTLQGYMLARICIYLNGNWLSRLQSLFQEETLPPECINPEAIQAASYNIEQALIAVGSGGWLGRGWASGTQNTLFFLRVRHSDFIFSVISEELGLIGASVVLLLLLFVVWRLLHIAESAQDLFGRLLAIGVAAVIFFQVLVNVGMNISIVPVTGLTLPFISYGGSSLISMLFVIGLAQSVAMRHRKIEFI